ncbi:MAG: E3 binding domain-containing protein, partial [Acidimicrobiia bacterium]|nr:E3 binding domain-containing protein [Acidimicrobiia bacterium]
MTHTRDFVLPDLGEGLESAEITTWLVEEGQSIELNQVLCLVETAKAVVEVPSPFAGRISKRHGDEGDEIPVGTILVSIEVAGEAPPSAGDVAGPPVLVGYGTSPGASRRRRNRSASVQASTPDRVRAKPAVRQRARELGVDIASLAPGSGPGETITRADVEAAAAAPPAPDTAPATEPAEPADTAPATEPAAATTPEASIGSGRTIELRGIRAIIA